MEVENILIGILGTITGSLLTLSGSLMGSYVSRKNKKQEILTSIVTKERSQWRTDMRNLSSQYIVVCRKLIYQSTEELINEHHQVRVLIKLKLNHNKKHYYDESILSILNENLTIIESPKRHMVELHPRLERFELLMQCLIKKEWDKSKQEAKTGALSLPDRAV